MTKKRKRRRLRKSIRIFLSVLLAFIVVAIIALLVNFNIHLVGAKSIHEDALEYKTRDALVFYPDSEVGREKAKEICQNAEKNAIIDYELTVCGDYIKVSYPDGTYFYIDSNNNDLVIGEISDELKPMISDMLRYQMKEAEIDEAYTLEFLEETYYENLDLSKTSMSIVDDNLVIHFNRYEFDLKVPIKYIQEGMNLNLGYENEEYQKQHYVSNNRKRICFTFDDGPYIPTSSLLVDELYKYDCSATFYILGIRLNEDNINFCKESIEKGMEYGSHSQNHKNLKKLSLEDATNEIYTPYYDLLNSIGYEMKTYRPPYGTRSSEFEKSTNLTAVLWDVDSEDWNYRSKYSHDACVEVICESVKEGANENDVVLFHDIYDTSVDAVIELIHYYINEGYQIVSASELMDSLDISDVKAFYGK